MGRILRRIDSASTQQKTNSSYIEEVLTINSNNESILPDINRLSLLSSANLPSNSIPVTATSSSSASGTTFLPILNLTNPANLKSKTSFSSPATNNNNSSSNNHNDNAILHQNCTMEVGLENLGNSCFMNSSLQCLLHIEPLTSYFLSGQYQHDVNPNSPMKGSLASTFGQLVKEMFEMKDGGSISPVLFFKQLRVLAPHLLDYSQQDAQEFLRFVLDGLCEDLCRKKGQERVRSKSIISKDERNSFRASPMKSGALDKEDSKTNTTSRGSYKRLSHKAILDDDTRNDNSATIATNSPIKQPRMPEKSTTKSEGKQEIKSPNFTNRNNSNYNIVHKDISRSGEDVAEAMVSIMHPEVDYETILPHTSNNTTSAVTATNTQSKVDIEAEAKKAWDAYLKFNDSVVADIFAGQLQSTITCLTCHSKSHCFDPFLDLSVPIPRSTQQHDTSSITGMLRNSYETKLNLLNINNTTPGRVRRHSVDAIRCTLEECLLNFTVEEVLDGENQFYCEFCKEKKNGTKKLSVFKYPKILVIHIKRFRAGKAAREKLTTDVIFPLKNLDLSPFLSIDRKNNIANKLLVDSSPLYDLIGISHHSGTMHGGHYIATIDINNSKDGVPTKWMNFNDAKVTCVGVNSLNGPSAYVLFYKLQQTENN